jgi:hypothetical protein
MIDLAALLLTDPMAWTPLWDYASHRTPAMPRTRAPR